MIYVRVERSTANTIQKANTTPTACVVCSKRVAFDIRLVGFFDRNKETWFLLQVCAVRFWYRYHAKSSNGRFQSTTGASCWPYMMDSLPVDNHCERLKYLDLFYCI